MNVTSILEPAIILAAKVLCHPKIQYVDRLKHRPKIDRPSILVINHTGHLDGPIVNTALHPEHIHSLAAKDRFAQKGFGFFLRNTRCIPIDRENPDLEWIHEAIRILNVDKEHVAIYPEGRHGKHREQLPFHPGVVMLAAIAQKPIVMIYQDGPVRFFHTNGMIVSEPFSLDAPLNGLNSDYLNEQAVKLQDRMTGLMNEYIRRNG